MSNDFLFSSESVTEGHPDKLCDQISDAILDECLRIDKNSRVACETMITTNHVIIAGEITINGRIDYDSIAKDVIKNVGYDSKDKGLDYNDVEIINFINKQSEDISLGVSKGKGKYREQGAGDQGIMFGYATNESEVLMPIPIYYAHKLAKKLADYRKNKILNYLRPDGKTQITIEYRDNSPYRIHTIVISSQHDEGIEYKRIKNDLIRLAKETLPEELIDEKTIYYINPTGRFVKGGPASDCGLTGRKIIVDSYGGMGRHGGGAFSGKDPTKVDRSAAYAARYIAKNIVASGITKECEVQLAYAIGYHRPVSININTFGKSQLEEETIEKKINENLPLTPEWIIEKFELKRPIYFKTAAYGHFGQESKDFKWEDLDFTKNFFTS